MDCSSCMLKRIPKWQLSDRHSDRTPPWDNACMVVKQEKYVSEITHYSGKSLTWQLATWFGPSNGLLKWQAKKDTEEISMRLECDNMQNNQQAVRRDHGGWRKWRRAYQKRNMNRHMQLLQLWSVMWQWHSSHLIGDGKSWVGVWTGLEVAVHNVAEPVTQPKLGGT